LDCPTFLSPNPWDSSKQVLEETKLSSPEVQGCDTTYYRASSMQDPELHLTVTAAKAAPNPKK